MEAVVIPETADIVSWFCTRRCNRACSHCNVGVVPVDAPSAELSTVEATALIRDLADSQVFVLHFSGGEPFVRPDFLDLVELARSLGMTVLTSTNGVGMTERVARRLKELGLQCLQ